MNTPIESTHPSTVDAPGVHGHPHVPGAWSGLGTVLLYFVLQFAIGLVVGFLAAIGLAFGLGVVAGLHHTHMDAATVARVLQAPDMRIVIITTTLVVTAAAMLWFIHRRWRSLWRVAQPPGLGFRLPANGWYFLLAVVAGLVVSFAGGLLAHALGGGNAPHQDVSVWAMGATSGARALLALGVVVVAPLAEEAIFRGVLLSGLLHHMRAWLAVLATAIVFGLVHLPDFKFAWYAIPTLVLLGVLLAWLRLQSRSLWTSVVAHAAFNGLGVVGWFLATTPHP